MAALRAEGGRSTVQRRAIVTALLGAPRHVTAEELADSIHREHPEIATTTIYRTLDALERQGLVQHAHLGHGPAVYHLAARSTTASNGASLETSGSRSLHTTSPSTGVASHATGSRPFPTAGTGASSESPGRDPGFTAEGPSLGLVQGGAEACSTHCNPTPPGVDYIRNEGTLSTVRREPPTERPGPPGCRSADGGRRCLLP